MKLYGAPQQIMTALPDERELWHAGSGRKEMEQADRLCHTYVERMLQQESSGFEDIMCTILQYADMRQKEEGFGDGQKEDIVKNGREAAIKEGMNDVYEILREYPMALQKATPVQNLAAQETLYPSLKMICRILFTGSAHTGSAIIIIKWKRIVLRNMSGIMKGNA